MKKIYAALWGFAFLAAVRLQAQTCPVNITPTNAVNNSNTTVLTCAVPSIVLTASTTASGVASFAWAASPAGPSITVTAPGTYAVIMTVVDTPAGITTCSVGASVIITEDKAKPTVVVQPTSARVCSGGLLALAASGANGGYSWTWPQGSSNGFSLTDHPANASASPIVVPYTVTGTGANGCLSDPVTVPVTVDPLPAASLRLTTPTAICQNKRDTLVFSATGAARPYTFIFSATGGNTQLVSSGANSDTAYTVVPTGTPGTVAYNLLSVTDGNGCSATVGTTASVTVNEGPALTSATALSVCDSSSVNYTATSSVSPTNFFWTRDTAPGISNPASSGSTAAITEALYNTSVLRQRVTYRFTLTGAGCSNSDSVIVTVNPTPKINPISNLTFCNGSLVNGISFSSSSPDSSFSWKSNNLNMGLPAGGTGSIPPFTIINTRPSRADTAVITVSVFTGPTRCKGKDTSFLLIVGPGPALLSPKARSVCNGVFFRDSAISSLPGTSFAWKRIARDSITASVRDTAGTAVITDTLTNLNAVPVVVKYVLYLTAGTNCKTIDTLRVTVNPTPKIVTLRDTVFCNGTAVSGIAFGSVPAAASFTWTNSDPSIGLPAGGTGNIPAFVARNTADTAKNASILVSVKFSDAACEGTPVSFRIKVNPSPARPGFTSASTRGESDTLRLCSGSENINFNVTVPVATARYNWIATPSGPVIRNGTRANTVISFNAPGTFAVQVMATDTATKCQSAASQIVTVSTAGSGIQKEKIFLMQPGDILVYPDNSLIGYQWGYDVVSGSIGDSVFSASVVLAGQVRHFYVPDKPFDPSKFLYWVQLQGGNRCQTKVYYNGPYAGLREPLWPDADNEVQVRLLPNPNRGAFALAVKGNIYGILNATVYNAVGVAVYQKRFAKTTPETTEQMNGGALPAGLYYLHLRSEDLKTLVTRFVVTR